MQETGFLIGTVLRERYRIERVLGEGAHGTVYFTADTQLEGVSWAVKEICENSLPLEERNDIIAHFYREAEILKTLNHTGLPKVVDVFAIRDRHYLVMEHIEGSTLQDMMEKGKRDIQTIIGWALKLCDILSYLHTLTPAPLIFRDLKPSNIMITSRGRLILVDFGIARYYSPCKSSDTVPLGTPGYAAPEQYGNAQTDARSDIFSLGATLFHLLSGADMAAFNLVFPPLSKLNTSVGPVLEGIVAQCLSRLPEQRYQSASEVKSALRPLYRKKTKVTAMASPPKRKLTHPLSTKASSSSKPLHLTPVPPAARLWNSHSYKPPIKIPFAPPWVMTLIENLDFAAKRAAWSLPLLLIASLYFFAFDTAKHSSDGFLSHIIFFIITPLCLFSLLVFVLHRMHSYAVFVFFILIAEGSIFYTLVKHLSVHSGWLH